MINCSLSPSVNTITKESQMKAISVSAVILSLVIGFWPNLALSNDLLSRDQAIAILIEEVIKPRAYADYYMAFGPQLMLKKGDRVEPEHLGGDPYPGSSRIVEGPTWFFWVDTNKWARFVHLTHFVYIDATIRNPIPGYGIAIDDQGWWPRINGVRYLDNPDVRWFSDDIVYGEAPIAPPTVPPRDY